MSATAHVALLAIALLSSACGRAFAADASAGVQSRDVCVVGAGPAGVAAALALSRRNRTVALLEREDGVGGQAYAPYVDPASGFRVNLGAIIIVPLDYPRVLALARELGIGIEEWAVPPTVYGQVFTLQRGVEEPVLAATGLAQPRMLAAAVERFVDAYRVVHPALSAPGGMVATLRLAPQLASPFDAWLRDIGAALLAPIAAQGQIQFGYGHLRHTSAASALNYFTPAVLAAMLPEPWTHTEALRNFTGRQHGLPSAGQFSEDVGFAEFFRRATQLLPAGSLHLGARITSVERPPPGGAGPVTIRFDDAGQQARTLRCGALVNTAVQTLAGLQYLGLDAEEQALFAHVRTDQLFSAAMLVTPPLPAPAAYVLPLPGDAAHTLLRSMGVRERGVTGGERDDARPALPLLEALFDPPYRGEAFTLYTVNPGAANRPAGVPYSANPGLAVSYSYSDVPVAADAVVAKARAAVRALDSRARHTAEVRAVREWAYYPRVSEAQLRAGWFARADAMQGRRGTLHAGGLFTFWDIEQAMRSGQELVERFFPVPR